MAEDVPVDTGVVTVVTLTVDVWLDGTTVDA
jgi:hypothetical protein